MRRWLLVSLLVLLVSASIGLPRTSAAIKIFPYTLSIDGKKVEFTRANHPVVLNGTTVAPFRPVFERLGLHVKWKPESKQIIGESSDLTITLTVGSKKAIVNGKLVDMPAAPVIIQGFTFVPLRFISESSGGELQVYGEEGGNNAWLLSAKQVQLNKAIMRNDLAETEKYLQQGADPTVGVGPLGPAIYSFVPYYGDNLEMVAFFLEYDMNVNAREEFNGITLLHNAVLYSRYEIVKYLLEHGADPSIESVSGTPLEIAEKKSFPEDQQNADAIAELLKSYLHEQPES
ncbi:hypothetical protein BK133_10540 [Paenibacillus sp. FSL H8-0548]|uniref:stalk domain-containing protein n=1 Tax=Paenibacillus sp. FSL H8-0548 TaxID=1920422 RepID=UPI00096D9B32|nr:stalk domain-containing protein [Paenibacillus sp. FSL H8-0548]OMF35144.1 hypothetical protein BK133_10540 [Paenibacillus sp. FSL H8-0548]